MTDYLLSELLSTSAPFDPAEDFLLFDLFGTANNLNIANSGSSTLISLNNGLRATLTGVSVAQLTSGNFSLFGGGLVLMGDNTLATANDGSANIINGGTGGDLIRGLGGNDTIDGSYGNDNINGNTGEDSILGNEGDDSLLGGADNDTILGGNGDDTIRGDKGDDLIIATAGNNNINGNEGNDTIIASSATDYLRGGKDNDSITGSSGRDTIMGDLGDDTISAAPGIAESVLLRGGDGNDSITAITGDATSFVDINGNTGDDSIMGGLGRDTLRGGKGNDTVLGNAGNDSILGDIGDDSLAGGAGANTLKGGSGNDTLFSDAGVGNEITGGEGVDSFVLVNRAAATDIIYDFDIDTELIDLSDASFSHIQNLQDIGITQSGVDAVLDLGNGYTLRLENVVGAGLFNPNFIGLGDPVGTAGNDTLVGDSGDNSIQGFAGNDSILGLEGDDTLDGGSGNDTIFGATGNDSIFGGSENDVINGDDGADTIIGGSGNDTITLGAGSDVYVVNEADISASNTTTINDFVVSADKIDYQGTTVSNGAVTTLSFLFVSNPAQDMSTSTLIAVEAGLTATNNTEARTNIVGLSTAGFSADANDVVLFIFNTGAGDSTLWRWADAAASGGDSDGIVDVGEVEALVTFTGVTAITFDGGEFI